MSKVKNFDFLTVNTGHTVMSSSADVTPFTIASLEPLVINGGGAIPFNPSYKVTIIMKHGEAVFNIQSGSTPLIQCILCLQKSVSTDSWNNLTKYHKKVFGTTTPTSKPKRDNWLAVILLPELFQSKHLQALSMMADFERSLAWTIISYVENNLSLGCNFYYSNPPKQHIAMSDAQYFAKMEMELLNHLRDISLGNSTEPEILNSTQEFDCFPALLNGILNTAEMLRYQGDSFFTATYNENFGDCVFEFQTKRNQWLICQAPMDCSERIHAMLKRFIPHKLRNLGTEFNPYVSLEPHHVRTFHGLCHSEYQTLVRHYAHKRFS